MYVCPVCGYDGLRRPPINFLICPSCGTEFGYSDSGSNYLQLQFEWLLEGAHWYSITTPPPIGWDPYKQLRRLNERRTNTVNVRSQVRISGTIVEGIRAAGMRIAFVQENDLASYTRPIHADA